MVKLVINKKDVVGGSIIIPCNCGIVNCKCPKVKTK